MAQNSETTPRVEMTFGTPDLGEFLVQLGQWLGGHVGLVSGSL